MRDKNGTPIATGLRVQALVTGRVVGFTGSGNIVIETDGEAPGIAGERLHLRPAMIEIVGEQRESRERPSDDPFLSGLTPADRGRRSNMPASSGEGHCGVCGWPLKGSTAEGCVHGNCSQRPLPSPLTFSTEIK